ncbi:MAG: bifunctional phosphoribosylaminoimidazolecarboxamide formyltransferase/IMP cyclohydrolase, partial [Anaerolineae bacterium]|nr:bifunctional phosphoribosylaminoimidazolecarboxamide formyltransferase/IMP cyclohydrolase [Anaerolineae bacterium]
VHGGVLVQSADTGDPESTVFKTVTVRQPTDQEMLALQFAWKAVTHIKSNAIVLAVPNATIGVGGGLPSRVDAVQLAVAKAGERAKGAVMASDAFFPFSDNIEVAAAAGITAVIQPGGSIRDNDVIEAANKADIAMIFTGTRHFRH